MSILDDAIREHLELKRAHGADESELKRLEDEAFGPAERPGEEGPFAEAPTEFLGTAVEEATPPPDGGRRMPNIADLQEAPPPPAEELPAAEPPTGEVPTDAAPAEAPEAEPEAPEAGAPAAPEAPAEPATPGEPETSAEEQPAMEHQTIPAPAAEPETPAEPEPAAEPESASEPEPPISPGPSTEEREAIAEHPTEFFDVEAELDSSEADAASEKPSPTDEQLLDSQLNEPRLAPVEPIDSEEELEELEIADEEPSEEYDDDFFSEQRLSDELNQALEAPVTDEHEALPEPEPLAEPPTPAPPARTEEGTAIFDIEDEDEEESGEHDVLEPEGEHEDVLENTPDFLEDAPDDDDLWFEQRPPKDFDFDD